jgi:hypothetical protein
MTDTETIVHALKMIAERGSVRSAVRAEDAE